MKKQKSASNPPSRTTRSTPARPSSKPASRRRPTAAKKVTAVIHEPFLSEFSPSVQSASPAQATPPAPAPEQRSEPPRSSEPPPSVRRLDAAAAANYRQAYAAARVMNPDGRVRLDEARFAQALADLRVDPLVEQDLYTWALLAAADGDAALFSEEALELRSA